MRKLLHTLFLSAGIVLASSAGATVITGTIHNIDGDHDGKVDDELISRISFTVTAGTKIFFDTLVIEDATHDLNHDGHMTAFDSDLMLFSGNKLLQDVDDSDLTFGDGSIDHWDAAFNYTFNTAGTYMIALGQRSFSTLDALNGYIPNHSYSPMRGTEQWGAWQLGMTVQAGSLSNVTSLDSTAVPEPASLALIGAGLLGVGLARRRRS